MAQPGAQDLGVLGADISMDDLLDFNLLDVDGASLDNGGASLDDFLMSPSFPLGDVDMMAVPSPAPAPAAGFVGKAPHTLLRPRDYLAVPPASLAVGGEGAIKPEAVSLRDGNPTAAGADTVAGFSGPHGGSVLVLGPHGDTSKRGARLSNTSTATTVSLPVEATPAAKAAKASRGRSRVRGSGAGAAQPTGSAARRAAAPRRRKRRQSNALGGKLPVPPPEVAADPQRMAEFMKREERKRKNRLAAEKSRKKRKAVEALEAQELLNLREVTKTQEQTIAALRAENQTLKGQLDFFRNLFSTTTAVAGSAAAAAAMAAASSMGAVHITDADRRAAAQSAARRAAVSAAAASVGAGAGSGAESDADTGSIVSSAASVVSTVSTLSRVPESPRADDDAALSQDEDAGNVSASSMSTAGSGGLLRARKRARRRTGSVETRASSPVAPTGAMGAGAGAGNGGMRSLAVGGALLALVFGFVLTMNLPPEELANLDLSTLNGGGMGMMGMGMGMGFADGVAAEGVVGGPAGAAAGATAGSGRVLHATPAASGMGHLAMHGHTMEKSMAGWSQSVGAADAGALAAAFDVAEAPPVPQMWTPSTAVTYVLYALGMKRFAEVVLVNALLLGVACGLWAGVQRCRVGKRSALPTDAGEGSGSGSGAGAGAAAAAAAAAAPAACMGEEGPSHKRSRTGAASYDDEDGDEPMK